MRGVGRSSRPAIAPGLAVAAAGGACALALHQLADALNVLTAAVLLGVVVRSVHPLPQWAQAGAGFARRRLLQVGVVLLGLKLSVHDVVNLGAPALGLVTATVLLTFFGTRWIGRLAGLPPAMSLFIASGFSICGVSAIAAMSGTRKHEEEDVATAVALVTLCGSLAIVVLPLLRNPLSLSASEFGLWVGASVHDVGQVVATAGGVGTGALATAVVVKLVRVLMLAPLVAAAAVTARRSARRGAGGHAEGASLVPLFVPCFLAMVAVRTGFDIPAGALNAAATTQTALLATALFSLGLAVHLPTMVRTGRPALAVGLASWAIVASVSYAGISLLHE